jgi:hypothetical protein
MPEREIPPPAVTDWGDAKDPFRAGAGVDAAALVHVDPFEVRTLPDVPGEMRFAADVPLPTRRFPVVMLDRPVPPFATPRVPLEIAEAGTFEMVFVAPLRDLFVSVSVVFLPRIVSVDVGSVRVADPFVICCPSRVLVALAHAPVASSIKRIAVEAFFMFSSLRFPSRRTPSRSM